MVLPKSAYYHGRWPELCETLLELYATQFELCEAALRRFGMYLNLWAIFQHELLGSIFEHEYLGVLSASGHPVRVIISSKKYHLSSESRFLKNKLPEARLDDRLAADD